MKGGLEVVMPAGGNNKKDSVGSQDRVRCGYTLSLAWALSVTAPERTAFPANSRQNEAAKGHIGADGAGQTRAAVTCNKGRQIQTPALTRGHIQMDSVSF